jgi:hypothetical protein
MNSQAKTPAHTTLTAGAQTPNRCIIIINCCRQRLHNHFTTGKARSEKYNFVPANAGAILTNNNEKQILNA